MFNTDELLLLNQTRESFYSMDWKYGEIFDSNFVDCLACMDITFQECISLARDDTNTYMFLEESAPNITKQKIPRHFDA